MKVYVYVEREMTDIVVTSPTCDPVSICEDEFE